MVDITDEYFKVVSDEDTAEETIDEVNDRIVASISDPNEHNRILTTLHDQVRKHRSSVPNILADLFMSTKMNDVPTPIIVDFMDALSVIGSSHKGS